MPVRESVESVDSFRVVSWCLEYRGSCSRPVAPERSINLSNNSERSENLFLSFEQIYTTIPNHKREVYNHSSQNDGD